MMFKNILCLIVVVVGVESMEDIASINALLAAEVFLMNSVEACRQEYFDLVGDDTFENCRDYESCLVLALDLVNESTDEIENTREQFQEILDRLVGCQLDFLSVVKEIRGQMTTTTSTQTTPPPTTASTSTAPPPTPLSTTLATTTTPSTTPPSTTPPSTTPPSTTPPSTTPPSTTPLSTTPPSTTPPSTTPPSTTPPSTTTPSTTTPSTTTPSTTPPSTTPPSTISTPVTTSAATIPTSNRTTRRIRSTTTPRLTTTPRPATTKTPAIPDCIDITRDDCSKRPDGDYMTCFPLCQKGVYISCSNRKSIYRLCPLGRYRNFAVEYFGRIVFNPPTQRCEYKSSLCPRNLDTQAAPNRI